MSYKVLARKWRPKRFQDVIGQSHITTSLQNSILNNRLGHAYIFSGTRGIGKTSVARVFAKSLRCENRQEDANPCGTCESCLDFETNASMNVLEIDGASNNSVDDVRELIGNVQYLPSRGEYKVFIIDEVHMLSTSAFNALLKTLEEPPAHAVFILATTEPEKLLGTVLSRCQRFDFRNAVVADLVDHIKTIAKAEGITFENDEIIKQICSQGKGSFRDTLSLMDQVLSFSTDNNITEETVSVSLGLARTTAIRSLVKMILAGNQKEVTTIFNGLIGENVSPKNIITSTLEAIFFYIENIENKNLLTSIGLVDEALWNDISAPEVFWIYETLSKDVTWALTSLLPEKSCDISLQKITLRREFFKKKLKFEGTQSASETEVVTEKTEPKVEVQSEPVVETQSQNETAAEQINEPVAAAPVGDEKIVIPMEENFNIENPGEFTPSEPETIEEEAPIEMKEEAPVESTPIDESWEGFLKYLEGQSPASASNLEQGNIISPLEINDSFIRVVLGFSFEGKVFFDYLQGPEVYKKLVANIAGYFKRSESEVQLEIKYLDEESKKEANFLSRVEIKEKQDEEKEDMQKNEILTDPLIQKAENIFNSKIDKIVIEKPKES